MRLGRLYPALSRIFFAQEPVKKLIKKLKEAGVNIKEDEEGISKTPLTAKTIVFTGELESLSRLQAEDLARKAGETPLQP